MIESIFRALGVALMVFLLGEIAKRSSYIAAIAASCPVATVAAGYLLYMEGQSEAEIGAFVWKTALLLVPALVFFIGFPMAIRRGVSLSVAMPVSLVIMTGAYALYIYILQKMGFEW